MKNVISEETKHREGRGLGHGKDYKPWIMCRDLMSLGVTSCYPDWKTGRMVQCLSQAELGWFLRLRWDDRVTDIREQFPLDRSVTDGIARSLGVNPVRNGSFTMTTDFLVDIDGGNIAVSVKDKRDAIKSCSERRIALLNIEKSYWDRLGVPWFLVYGEDLDKTEIRNIKDVVTCYRPESVHDEASMARHLIATKKIAVDLHKEIDYPNLIKEIKERQICTTFMKEC